MSTPNALYHNPRYNKENNNLSYHSSNRILFDERDGFLFEN